MRAFTMLGMSLHEMKRYRRRGRLGESEKSPHPITLVERESLQLSEKIVLAMFAWVVFALLLALNAGVEVLLTLILIGVLIIRELTDSFTPVRVRERVDFFIYTFLVVFAIIVVRRVWEILS
ncbi:MAG TPA: hypothetical protein VMY17_03145 [Thermoplasmata archaeon]|nr:hypothetical protein [Thermoplasmata archaeon]